MSYFDQRKVPYQRPVPLLGNLAPFFFGRITHANQLRRLYNHFSNARYFGFYDFMSPIYVIRDPELFNTIAIKHFDHFMDHLNVVNEDLERISRMNLFGLRGDHWHKMRKLLSPSFTSSKIKIMFGLMCQCAETFTDVVTNESGKSGKAYEMKDMFRRYATDVVATSAFGISVDSFNHPKNEFFLHADKTMNFDFKKILYFFMRRTWPLLTNLLRIRVFNAEIEDFFKNIINDTVKARDEQGIVRPDMIQLMMETRDKNHGRAFDIDEMTAQALIFFLAGFDNISTCLSFLTYELAVNPDVQNKIRAEIEDVLKQTNGKPTYEAINGMKYLDAALTETMRFYPLTLFHDRVCTKNFEMPPATPDGKSFTIKPGERVWISSFALHHDPKYYSEPEKFNPDRFLNSSVDNSIYMPFGVGPRICIAIRFAMMEMKIMIFYLLWRCIVELDAKTKIPLVMKKASFSSSAEGVPLLGNMAPFIFRRISFVDNIHRLYNHFSNARYFGFYDMMTPVYVIRDPELINTIAIKHFDNFTDHRNFVNEDVEPIAGRNLFGLRGDHWREMRKLLSPSFTSSKMKMMFVLMCQCAENFTDFVTTECGKSSKTYDMKDTLRRYATDVVATCAFGISVDSFNQPKNEFFLSGNKSINFDFKMTLKFLMSRNWPRLAKLLRIRVFTAEIENFFKNIVNDTVKARDEHGIVRPDMIQLMMQTRDKNYGPAFDIDEMTAQAFVFFLAGFDSVSTGMCFLAHEIAVNPDVQTKLRAEIEDVLKQNNGKPTYEAINGMKYLDAVVTEVMRLYPLASFLDRVCTKDFEMPPATPDGKPVTIKPGESVWFQSYSLHRDPKYYSEPLKFNPDRFLNESVDNSVYMPFGIGPRICIGNRFALMEAKIMIFYLLWRCDLEPDVKTKIPMVLDKSAFITTAEGGFWLKLRARNQTISITSCLSNGHNLHTKDT
ncbi:hypothetical protein DMN91_000766 [Ooceraea biroi]|uniref:Cytochrome P450 9e2 n=1 Tax=Ooceraea biroi TaxID=2015173 RepID=A0A3L8E2Q8_OOCBI|nr:hypothetical protein DMN91_000766 [Ooceraea biroi]